jgi:von Willebrand factor type C domain
MWDEGCETCKCKEGVVKCYKKECPSISCKNPVLLDGECCMKCLSEFEVNFCID